MKNSPKKVYEFQRLGDRNPYDVLGVGSLEILKKFSENKKNWRGDQDCGFEIKNDNIIVDPKEIRWRWKKYPDSIKTILKERVPEKLPNFTKSDEELMEQVLEAVDILEEYGFEILEIPKKIGESLEVSWTYTVPNEPQYEDFSIWENGYVWREGSTIIDNPMSTYQQLAIKLINEIDNEEKQLKELPHNYKN